MGIKIAIVKSIKNKQRISVRYELYTRNKSTTFTIENIAVALNFIASLESRYIESCSLELRKYIEECNHEILRTKNWCFTQFC
jgi:hypothetical protein